MQETDIDDEGYLIEPNTWSEEIAKQFALQENIETMGVLGLQPG